MPEAITHYLQVERVVCGLKKLYPEFEYDKDAFLWGAQGPNFMLSYKKLPPKNTNTKKYGAYLENESINNLKGILINALKDNNPTLLEKSYICGFLCHSVLDKCAFPFINFSAESLKRTYEKKSLKVCMNKVETTLDVIILRYEKRQLPTEIKLKELLPQNQKLQNFMGDFFCTVLNENYNAQVTKDDIFKAINEFRKFFGFITDRTGIKKNFIKKIEKLMGKDECISSLIRDVTEEDDFDYSNFLHNTWSWPMGDEFSSKESFFEIYEKSINESIDLIGRLSFNN